MKKIIFISCVFVFASIILVTYANNTLTPISDGGSEDNSSLNGERPDWWPADWWPFQNRDDRTMSVNRNESIDIDTSNTTSGQTNNSNRSPGQNNQTGGTSVTPSNPGSPGSTTPGTDPTNPGTDNPNNPGNNPGGGNSGGNEPGGGEPGVDNPDLIHGPTTFKLRELSEDSMRLEFSGNVIRVRGTIGDKAEQINGNGYYIPLQLIAPASYSQTLLSNRMITINASEYNSSNSPISGEIDGKPFINVNLLMPSCNSRCVNQVFRFSVDWGTGHITNYEVQVFVTRN